MAAVTIHGALTGTRDTDFTGYVALVFYSDNDGNFLAAQAPADKKGRFAVALPSTPAERSAVTVQAHAPGGLVVGQTTLPVDQIHQKLKLEVSQAVPVRVEKEDTEAGRRVRITGRVLNPEGDGIPVGVPVLIAGAGPQERELRVVVTTTTLADGYFGFDIVREPFVQAAIQVAHVEPQPVALENGVLPTRLVVMLPERINVGQGDLAVVPRTPGHSDFEADTAIYNEDRGGRCVNFTTPNRTLEEVQFQAVVRTTQPAIKGFVLDGNRQEVDPAIIGRLETLLRNLDRVEEKRTRSLLTLEKASAGTTLMLKTRRSDEAEGTRDQGMIQPNTLKFFDGIETLNETKVLDNQTLVKAFAHIAGYQTSEEIGKAVQNKAKKAIGELIKSRVADAPARHELDATHTIDWDSTPTTYQATEIAHGHILTFKQVWRADGYSLGDLLYSLPLAPGQKKLISILDWDRNESTIRMSERHSTEQFAANLRRDRDISETINTALHESMRARSDAHTEAFGGGLGVFIGPIVIGGGGGYSNAGSSANQVSTRAVSAQSLQQVRDRTTQAASLVRGQRATVVQSSRQGESLQAQTEVVANYNHCHAMTVEYFEVLRHFKVDVELAHVQECLFVPLEMSEFDAAKALRWKQELQANLPLAMKGTLDALEREQSNWDKADVPLGRYADETLRWFDGEIYLRLSLPRPDDKSDGTFDSTAWASYAALLPGRQTEDLWRSHIATVPAAGRDAAWSRRVAPIVARTLAGLLRVELLDSNQVVLQTIDVDPTLVGRFGQDVPVLVSLRSKASTTFTVTREGVRFIKIKLAPQVDTTTWTLPSRAKAILHSATLHYRTDHLHHSFMDGRFVGNDLSESDMVTVATPLDRQERRNPCDEDRKQARRLLAHLNEHVERYHRAIWLSMDPNRRILLFDGFIAPNAGGRSVASVVENRLVGIVGNSMVLPVAPGIKLDPSYVLEEGALLKDRYAGPSSAPPFRISIPTRGVFAEAVLGDCTACEPKDDSRFWRWEESSIPDAPPSIGDVDLGTRRGTPPTLKPDEFPEPIVQIQTSPSAPAPTGLAAALQLIGTPNLFKDMTGVKLNTENAAKAFNAALDTAEFFGMQASAIAKQRYLNKEMERNVGRIQKAKQAGLINRAQASELTENLFRAATGQPAQSATMPTQNPAVQSMIDRAARSENGRVSVRNPAGRVDIRTNQRIGGDSFAIDPSIVPINQPSNMVCWAAAGAMLISWRDRVSYTLAAAIQQVGNEWVQRLNNNEGLTLDQMAGFNRAVGLRGEPAMCYEARALLRMLQEHGPLLVIGDDAVANNQISHALILTGIRDANDSGVTTVTVADPNGGTLREMSYIAFAQSMEAQDPAQLGLGVFHF